MNLLIDAFNLIYKFPELEEAMYRGELEQAMAGLLTLLKKMKHAYEHHTGQKKRSLVAHVFFDGKRKPGDETRRGQYAGMELYYSQDLSADHLIAEFIQRHPRPGELLVVSSDKQIREVARIHRCQRQTSEDFAAWMDAQIAHDSGADRSADIEEKPDIPPDEQSYWERVFQDRS